MMDELLGVTVVRRGPSGARWRFLVQNGEWFNVKLSRGNGLILNQGRAGSLTLNYLTVKV